MLSGRIFGSCIMIWAIHSEDLGNQDWKRSVFIPLPKKGDARDCCNYRTIALIPHASKVFLKIIQQRLRPIIEAELPDSQAGFKRGRGTRDHITNLRWIMEKCHEHQKNIYICFINYSKAFDCIEHDKLWKALQELGVPAHLIQLLRSFYKDQEATVRTQHGDTEWFKIEKGCILSPFLFNLYAEMIIKEIRSGRIGNRCEYLSLRIKKESEKMGLHLNIKKMKIMTTAGNGAVKITVNIEEIECVKVFCFLGSMIDRTGDCTRVTNKEVLERIKPEMSLEGKITRLRLTYFGHVMRSDSLEKAMMLGMVSGTRRRGCQRTRWLDAIKTDTGLGIEQLKEKVQDQKVWQEMAYRIAESRIL
uniref:Reverse transcriptase domain-containing protein n=1 Tax=Lepisosteus oculatus TaxID=7918 RepID=W5NAB6_LEPOC